MGWGSLCEAIAGGVASAGAFGGWGGFGGDVALGDEGVEGFVEGGGGWPAEAFDQVGAGGGAGCFL